MGTSGRDGRLMFPRSIKDEDWFLGSMRLFDALACFSRSLKCCSLLARMSDFGACSTGAIDEDAEAFESGTLATGVDSLPEVALILSELDLVSSTSPSSTSWVCGLGVETPTELHQN